MKDILFGVAFIFIGYQVFLTGEFNIYYGYMVDLGLFKYLVSFVFISLGLYFILTYRIGVSPIECSRCPKCKTNYTYTDLKDGICPTCNIKTIDMKEYFKKYPDEDLEDV